MGPHTDGTTYGWDYTRMGLYTDVTTYRWGYIRMGLPTHGTTQLVLHMDGTTHG